MFWRKREIAVSGVRNLWEMMDRKLDLSRSRFFRLAISS
jgi:hypothetical protein